jgi:hypothetical protein
VSRETYNSFLKECNYSKLEHYQKAVFHSILFLMSKWNGNFFLIEKHYIQGMKKSFGSNTYNIICDIFLPKGTTFQSSLFTGAKRAYVKFTTLYICTESKPHSHCTLWEVQVQAHSLMFILFYSRGNFSAWWKEVFIISWAWVQVLPTTCWPKKEESLRVFL